MKIAGIVLKTLHLKKTVEIKVPEGTGTVEICDALQSEACETGHGWVVDSEKIDVTIVDRAFGAIVDVCCHRVTLRYWDIDCDLTPELEAALTEGGKERANMCIPEGCRSGQLCHLCYHDGEEEEIHGWWEISS